MPAHKPPPKPTHYIAISPTHPITNTSNLRHWPLFDTPNCQALRILHTFLPYPRQAERCYILHLATDNAAKLDLAQQISFDLKMLGAIIFTFERPLHSATPGILLIGNAQDLEPHIHALNLNTHAPYDNLIWSPLEPDQPPFTAFILNSPDLADQIQIATLTNHILHLNDSITAARLKLHSDAPRARAIVHMMLA